VSLTGTINTVDCTSSCTALFAPGDVVTITATPNSSPSSAFEGFGGDCTGQDPCVLTMDQDRAATAGFIGL
jgi:hypothetical protein